MKFNFKNSIYILRNKEWAFIFDKMDDKWIGLILWKGKRWEPAYWDLNGNSLKDKSFDLVLLVHGIQYQSKIKEIIEELLEAKKLGKFIEENYDA